MKAVVNGKIVLKNGVLENKVIVFDKKIIDICDKVPTNCEVIDAKGNYVCPGLIDIHIHGCKGFDAMDEDENAVEIISKGLAETGVTSFLPTTMTMSPERIYKAFDNIIKAKNKSIKGAKVLGAHMEGPFINEKYKGAQNPKYIYKPSFDFIKDYTDIIKVISYSPELDKDFEFTKQVKKETDIVLSICHSDASYSTGKEAKDLGVTNITHLFNGMTPLNHRNPGVVGLGLMSDMYCELIADKIHINKELFQFVIDSKGKDKLVLITDSMRAGCMPDGEYDLGGQTVYVKDNYARIASGSLAGSVLTLNKAVYNFKENTNLNIYEAINLASLNPAKSIKVDDKKKIEKDILICIDPGHQEKGDSNSEPVAPGSYVKKARVSSGATGVATKKPEYILNLEASTVLKHILEGKGYKVIMTRESHDVNISNSERAIFANNNKADMVVRVHADSLNNPGKTGASILIPAKESKYTTAIYEDSQNCANLISSKMKEAGIKVNGVFERGDLTGFNWSQVPVVLVEMGFLSNYTEDQMMSNPEYQTKLMQAISDGLDEYFANK